MTAESIHQTEVATEGEAPQQLASGVIVSMQQRLHERVLDPQERQMMDAFYDSIRQRYDIDPSAPSLEHAPHLSLATNVFLADVAERRIADDRQRHGQSSLILMPRNPLEQQLKEYYFGANGQPKSALLLREQRRDPTFEENKRPVYASVYTESTMDKHGFKVPGEKVPRATFFPQMGVGIRLESALRKANNPIAADSVEVVLMMLGKRFLERAKAAGQLGVIRTSGTGNNIQVPDMSDVPEHLLAENYRPRKPKA